MLSTTKSRVAVLACAALVVAGVASTTAAMAQPAASTTASYAPYTMVAGSINADASIENSKNIVSVTKSSSQTGVYCVQTRLAKVSDTVPQVTARLLGRVATVIAHPLNLCANRADTYTVSLWNTLTQQREAAPFFISVS